jgi:hypothetical protein
MKLSGIGEIIGLVITCVGITTAVVSWFFTRYIRNRSSKSEAEKARLELENAKLRNASGSITHDEDGVGRENADQLLHQAEHQQERLSTSFERSFPTEHGSAETPLFALPRCLPSDLEETKQAHLSTLRIITIENEVESVWKYDQRRSVAQLFFKTASSEKLACEVLLDAEDVHELDKSSVSPEGWFLYVIDDEGLSVLKLQFYGGEAGYISLYWCNYAIQGYLEAKARELTDDWDFEVTIGSVIGSHVGKQDT